MSTQQHRPVKERVPVPDAIIDRLLGDAADDPDTYTGMLYVNDPRMIEKLGKSVRDVVCYVNRVPVKYPLWDPNSQVIGDPLKELCNGKKVRIAFKVEHCEPRTYTKRSGEEVTEVVVPASDEVFVSVDGRRISLKTGIGLEMEEEQEEHHDNDDEDDLE